MVAPFGLKPPGFKALPGAARRYAGRISVAVARTPDQGAAKHTERAAWLQCQKTPHLLRNKGLSGNFAAALTPQSTGAGPSAHRVRHPAATGATDAQLALPVASRAAARLSGPKSCRDRPD